MTKPSAYSCMLQVKAMLDEAWYDQRKFAEGGWVTGLKYEDEIQDLLRVRLNMTYGYQNVDHLLMCPM